VAAEYYALFSELEDKNHDIYPPPSRNSKGKLATAKLIVEQLDALNLLKPGMAVLHVRCDAGTLLKLLRQRFPDSTLHGLDYFETNVRYVCEQDFASASLLTPGGIALPPGISYDLIIANHHFTHAINPRGDLAKLGSALREGGKILFYHEDDHDILLDPNSEYSTRLDIINFHKQLFVRATFENFLRHAGFAFEFLGHRRSTMTYIGAPTAAASLPERAAAALLDRQRQRIADWQKVARRYRYPAAIAHKLRPLLRRIGIRPGSQKAARAG
jgi:hypothetical protein